MNLVIKASGAHNIVIRPSALPAFYQTDNTVRPAQVEVYWHYEDESPLAARLIIRGVPGQQVQWPYTPIGDKNIYLRTVSISAGGVRSVRSLRDAPATLITFQREIEAPTVTQVGDATHSLITLAIDAVSEFAVKRRIRFADDEDMTTNVRTTIVPASFVDAAFLGALGREASAAEITIWRNDLKAADIGISELRAEAKAKIKGLFESDEYDDRARTDAEFVNDLYAAFFNRLPESQAVADTWITNIGISGRAAVLDPGFSESDEFHVRVDGYKPYLDVPAGRPLPRLVDLTRPDDGAGTRTIWVRVSHSSGGAFGDESPARSFTYADSGGAGGDAGDTDDPFQRDRYGLPLPA